jgi:hypothetical protein
MVISTAVTALTGVHLKQWLCRKGKTLSIAL